MADFDEAHHWDGFCYSVDQKQPAWAHKSRDHMTPRASKP